MSVRLAGLPEYRGTRAGLRERITSCCRSLSTACDDKSQCRSGLIPSVGVAGLRTVSLLKASRSLLPCHGQVQPVLRSDEVIVGVLAQVDLHPVDLPVKFAGLAGVV